MTLTLLIDLDDTLLVNSTDRFLPAYMEALTRELSVFAPQEKCRQTLLAATQKMLANTSSQHTLKEVFDEAFYPALGIAAEDAAGLIENFYDQIYPKLSKNHTPDPEIVTLIDRCFLRGYKVAIATNPLFPQTAVRQRLAWAGLDPNKYPFTLISSYETFHFTKPHLSYFAEILARLAWPDGPVMMVGNAWDMDIEPARQFGLPTFWVQTNANGGYAQPAINPTSPHSIGTLYQLLSWLDACSDEDLTPDFSSAQSSLAILAATPASLSSMLQPLESHQWARKPDPEEWSITEIACHLRDVDREVHLPRIESIRDQPEPFIEAVDADDWADERDYQHQDGELAMNTFHIARQTLIETIQALPSSDWGKTIRHTFFGRTTLAEILKIAARHDRLHIQQVFSHF